MVEIELKLASMKRSKTTMKSLKYPALLSALVLIFSLSSFARNKDNNDHSVSITDPVHVGSTQLKPGNYKVEWQGTGPDVQVSFMQDGKTVATLPGTLKTDDTQITQDAIVTDTAGNNAGALREIDFRRQKEAVIFSQSGM
jgi:hypothetical protein